MSSAHRVGELRLVVTMPEPWSESAREDFLRAVETVFGLNDKGPFAGLGVSVGDVSLQAASLVTWIPGTPKPIPDALALADVEVLVTKYGLSTPQVAKDAHALGHSAGYLEGFDAGRREGIAEAERPKVEPQLEYVEPEETQARLVVLGRAAPVFHLGPLSSEETAALAEIERSHSEVYSHDPHADEGRVPAYPTTGLDFEEA